MSRWLLLGALLLSACPADDWVDDAREMFLEGEEVDLDGNGLAEVRIASRFVDGRPRELTIDYDENGTIDAYTTYSETGWSHEADLDHDGRADYARRVVRHPDGVVQDITAFDANDDGAVDARARLTAWPDRGVYESVLEIQALGEFWPVRTATGALSSAWAQAATTGGPVTVEATCGASVDAINAAYAEGLSRGRDCLGKLNGKLARDFELAVASRASTVIACAPLGGPLAQADNVWDPSQPLGITVDPAKAGSITPTTMFHEVMHYVWGGHPVPAEHPEYTLDAITGCEDYCFGGGGKTACYLCSSPVGITHCEDEDDPTPGPCRDDPTVRCTMCGGKEEVLPTPASFCGTCDGRAEIMEPGDVCCGDRICRAGSLCGLCGDKTFCSSFESPNYCTECPEGPRVTAAGQQCCPPGQTYNRVLNLCEQRCPGGAAAGGDARYAGLVELGNNIGRFDVSWNHYSIPDAFTVYTTDGDVIFQTGCTGGSGSVTLELTARESSVIVEVEPNCAGDTGTIWDFEVSCAQ